ncbi:MAG: formylmethanofuran dehydrogenase subunit E family protein [Methanoregulaceae archaeon]
MKSHDNEYTSDELYEVMDDLAIPAKLKSYFRQVIPFHTYAAPGTLIGVFMVDYALEILGASPEEKLYAVCETPKCLPDAIQVIAHCTTGNNRLRVLPIGKFALSINRGSADPTVEGIRISVDPAKMKKYPVLYSWFTNSKDFDGKTMKRLLADQILSAGRSYLVAERVLLKTKQKEKWTAVTCPVCGEMVPDYMMTGETCGSCGSLKYYEKI